MLWEWFISLVSRFGWGSIPARLSFKEHAAWRPEKSRKQRDFLKLKLLIEWKRTRSSWVFPKNRGIPKMDGLYWKTLSKWMIWGYHYFRKHPYVCFFLKSFFSTGHNDFLKYQWMWALYVYVFCGCCGYMQFDPILNVSSLQCAWDIYSTPSMGEATEPTPVYSLEIRKQQINSPWKLTTWNLKMLQNSKKKEKNPHVTPGFSNPLGSIFGCF